MINSYAKVQLTGFDSVVKSKGNASDTAETEARVGTWPLRVARRSRPWEETRASEVGSEHKIVHAKFGNAASS